jgi:hypothetical protein
MILLHVNVFYAGLVYGYHIDKMNLFTFFHSSVALKATYNIQ